MKLIIIGPQAAGKGTQADLIAKRLNIPHISTGELLREEQRSGSALGKEIAAIIDKGDLVPDHMLWETLHRKLKHHPEGWLLDGFPRTKSQMALLDHHLPPEKVIFLDVPETVSLERITGRRICSTCGKDYHIKYKPSRQDNACDVDGGALVQRRDDTPAAVAKRLALYHAETEPLVKHYGRKVIAIDGDHGIEEVWHEIQKKLHV